MIRRAKFCLLLISLSTCLCLMSSTYSRYVAGTKSNINATFSKWQILINNNDITNQTNSSIAITPVIEENDNVQSDVLAPSSKGYFDIDINPTNVDVSFKYAINLDVQNENIPDLMITKYVIFTDSYTEGDELDVLHLNNNAIENTLFFNKDEESFKFQSFTIRVYFEWYDGENKLMDDESHTNIGYLAATDEVPFKIDANISFEQVI